MIQTPEVNHEVAPVDTEITHSDIHVKVPVKSRPCVASRYGYKSKSSNIY